MHKTRAAMSPGVRFPRRAGRPFLFGRPTGCENIRTTKDAKDTKNSAGCADLLVNLVSLVVSQATHAASATAFSGCLPIPVLGIRSPLG
jgi:hypothetical protein